MTKAATAAVRCSIRGIVEMVFYSGPTFSAGRLRTSDGSLIAFAGNRIIFRINGTYVRLGECQLREQLVRERLAAVAEDLKNKHAAGL